MPLYRIATRRCHGSGPWTIQTHALSDAEAVLVAAIAEQLIPLDDEPGLSPCRAAEFIDRLLDGGLSRMKPAYHAGLLAFEAACMSETGFGFMDLSPAERADYLGRVAHGHKLSAFFEIVRDHAKRSLQLEKPFVQSQHAV